MKTLFLLTFLLGYPAFANPPGADSLFYVNRPLTTPTLQRLFKLAAQFEGSDRLKNPGFIKNFIDIKKQDPRGYESALTEAIKGKDEELQRGALQALNITEIQETSLPRIKGVELLEALKQIRFSNGGISQGAKDHGSWLYDQLLFSKNSSSPRDPSVTSLNSPRKVAVVTAEIAGIFATGGLGGAALKYSQGSNAEKGTSRVTIIMPYYTHTELKDSEKAKITDTGKEITIPVKYDKKGRPTGEEKFKVHSYINGNTEILMLEHVPNKGQKNFFDNPRVPGETKFYGEKANIGNAFGAFSKAVAKYVREENYDIVMSADWQAGWTNVLLDQARKSKSDGPRTVLWLHNAAYKGDEFMKPGIYEYLGLDKRRYDKEDGANFFGRISPLKGAAHISDAVSTVSPQYAGEITAPRFGYGLEWTFEKLKKEGRIVGILNGIDLEEWTPKDFNTNDFTGKETGKLALQKKYGFTVDAKIPLIVMTARISDQKGFEFAPQAIKKFLEAEKAQIFIVGDADASLKTTMEALVNDEKIKDKIKWVPFSVQAERDALMYGDAMFLPSKFEPSGLNQQYALRTGAIPLVTEVGGLKETIKDGKNGYTMPVSFQSDDKTVDIPKTIDSAFALLQRFTKDFRDNPFEITRLRRNGMAEDSSWERRVAEYEALYDYVQENGSRAFIGHPIAEALLGMKPSTLLQVSREIRKHEDAVEIFLHRCNN